jgi:hypothetical protein
MHCLAWHIIFFLKSLRSLEEFRKNPHVKIAPKSHSTIFQSPAIIKKSNFIQKRIFPSLLAQSAQRPAGPSGLSAQPAPPPPLFFRRPRAHAWPISACAAMAYLPKAVTSSSLRSPVTMPSPSSLSPLNPLQTER